MRVTLICLVSTAWLATCSVLASVNPAEDYLHLPGPEELTSSPLTNQISVAIEHLNIQQKEMEADLMDRVRNLAKEGQTGSPDVKLIYGRLAQLADGSDVCSDELIEVTKHIVAMAKHRVGQASKLIAPIRHFGRLKFDACVKRHQDYFHMLLGLFVEESLDDVLAAALGISESSFKKTDELEKYEKLRGLDLIRDRKLKVGSMAKRAAAYEPKTGDDLSLLMSFFHAKCGHLQQMLGSVLDILALARMFQAEEFAYRKRLLKMGEQRRLCLAVGGAATRSRVEQSLASKLAESRSARKLEALKSPKSLVSSKWTSLRQGKSSRA